jgi:hypothetical protein
MHRLIALLLCLAASTAAATSIYRWVDPNGVVHYSDQSRPGAERIELDVPPGMADSPQPGAYTAPRPAEEETAPYQVCEIARPAAEEVFLNQWSMSARIRLEPALRPGHQLAVALDGRRLDVAASDTGEFEIANLERGTHTLLVLVQDARGRTLCESAGVTFHVRQPSVQAPRAENRPRF